MNNTDNQPQGTQDTPNAANAQNTGAVPPQQHAGTYYATPQIHNVVVPPSNEKNIRRVGTTTMALSLIVVGALMIARIFIPAVDLVSVLRFSPIILVFLGIEILIANITAKDKKLRYDGLSIFLTIVLILTSLVGGVVAEAGSSYRNYRDKSITYLEDYNDELNKAVEGISYISSISASSYNYYDWPFYGNENYTSNGVTIYLSETFKDETAFAEACAKVLDKINPILRKDTHRVQFTYLVLERGSADANSFLADNLYTLDTNGYSDRNLSASDLKVIVTTWYWSENDTYYYNYDIDAVEAEADIGSYGVDDGDFSSDIQNPEASVA